MGAKTLLNAVVATGAGPALICGKDIASQDWTIACVGTFDGTTSVKVEASQDGVNFFDTGIVFTAKGAQNLFGEFLQIRGNVTAGGVFAITMTIMA